ncbi:MAG: tetratricopeptide repeat protein [Armatimonadota bacterium]|nr:tetratricopeptide repeat protein [Armatimonadota bacterium]
MERRCRLVFLVLLTMLLASLPATCAFAATAAEQAQVMYDRAVALNDAGNVADAIMQLRSVLVQPETPGDASMGMVKALTTCTLAETLRQSGQLDEAQTLFKKVLSDYSQCTSQCADSAIGIAKIYRYKGEDIKALQQYVDALAKYPDKLNRAKLARGGIDELIKSMSNLSADMKSGIDKALTAYDTAKKEDDAMTAARRAAVGKAGAGDIEGAKADLLKLFANPTVQKSRQQLYWLANAQLGLGDKTNARVTYGKYVVLAAEEMDPEGYKLARIKTSYSLGDFDAVLSEATDAASAYAEGTSALDFQYYLAQGSYYSGQGTEAVRAFRQCLSLPAAHQEQNRAKLIEIAQKQVILQDKEGARSTFDRVLMLDTTVEVPQVCAVHKVEYLFCLHDYSGVILEAPKYLALYPEGKDAVTVTYWLARSYESTDQVDAALQTYDSVVVKANATVSSDSSGVVQDSACLALYQAGVCLAKRGRTQEAISKLDRATKEYAGSVWLEMCTKKLADIQNGNTQY